MKKIALSAALALALAFSARADVITDWNTKVGELVIKASVPTPVAVRAMAIVQTAVYDAVQSAGDGSIDAAVAAANRAAVAALLPAQGEAVALLYQSALAAIPDGPARVTGIAAGEKAAARVIERRANDGAGAAESYRPHTTPGVYVPTTIPIIPQWPERKPWMMENASQFRPGPPPGLASDAWARDFAEVKALGARTGSTRMQEQTDIAKFWEATLPPIYHGVVRSVATQPGRNVRRNARLFAAIAQAMDDAVIAVFDAKYQYAFWRPITAIRNGDLDGNDATVRDPSWLPFIETPMHPEYPCAHCILAAAVGTVIELEMGHGPMPMLSTSSYTAQGATRKWATPEEFIHEVSLARIYGGVHYRYSTEVGTAMGRQVGALAASFHFGQARGGP